MQRWQRRAARGQPPATFSFAPAVNYDYPSTQIGQVALGDLNGDGAADLAIATFTFSGFDGGVAFGVSLRMNNGSGRFSAPVDIASPGAPNAIALGDLNGDGKTDLAVAGSGTSVFLNQGGGVFSAPVTFAAAGSSIVLADLNGDGKTDIAVAGTDIVVLLNTGGGTFAAANYPGGSDPAALAVGDLNGDCRPDIAVADSGGGLSVLLNSGGGRFQTPSSYAVGTRLMSLTIADLNGDGVSDLAATTVLGAQVLVLLNYGDGTFTAAVVYSLSTSTSLATAVSSVASGDLNADGKVNLAVVTDCCGLGVLFNSGAGTFGGPNYDAATQFTSTALLGDLNGDGLLDAIGGGGGGRLSVLLNSSH